MTDPDQTLERDIARAMDHTLCPYAAASRHIVLPQFDGEDWRAFGMTAAASLRRVPREVVLGYDGFVATLSSSEAGSSIEALATSFRQFAEGMLVDEGSALDPAVVATEHWWLPWLGTRWFAVCLAPCYGRESSRAVPAGESRTFFVLQPVEAFDRRAVPAGTTIPQFVRERIRDQFALRGRGYDDELMQQDVESIKFIAPLNVGEPPVHWWA